ncbi:MAG: transglycosylase SLT domain-containing protein [Spirochaetaceae bacterium]|nr:MAG: transglycosylase SLT domain-containing protein [Spirochaetaceae bacterium]
MGMGRDLFRRKTIILYIFLLCLFLLFWGPPPNFAESRDTDFGPLPLRLDHDGRAGLEIGSALPALSVPATEGIAGTERAAGTEATTGSWIAILHDRSVSPSIELAIPEDPAVEQWRQRILAMDSRGLQDALERGRTYRRFISEQLAHRGLPQELIYLPILESHYRVRAVSRSGATGLWQIMTNTAAPLGLERNRWVDERRDFWKATEGALNKLAENYATFGDWDLALAAYNCGTGLLSRTIGASGLRDFWTLRDRGLLPPETAAYVPKFYALVSICSDTRTYGLETGWDQGPTWHRIPLQRSVELALLAEKAGLPLPLMEEAHAELETPITPPASGGAYYLKIPMEYSPQVGELLADPQVQLLRFTFHRIRSGDTFYALAEYYELTAALLMEANSGFEARSLRIGEQLRIPVFSGRPVKSEPIVSLSEADTASFTATHTVVAGDTLWAISRRYGTTAEILAWANERSLDAPLKPGETLNVPPEEQAEAQLPGQTPVPMSVQTPVPMPAHRKTPIPVEEGESR